jgi:hypothetical protein
MPPSRDTQIVTITAEYNTFTSLTQHSSCHIREVPAIWSLS